MKLTIKSAPCVICLFCASHVSSIAAPTNGLAIMSMTNPPVNDSYLIKADEPPHTWPEIWRDKLLEKSAIYFSDSVAWPAVGASIYAEEAGANPRTYFANAGENAMRRSVINSFRDSVVQLPGVFNSQDWADGLVAKLIADSIGHTPEESIRMLNTTPTASQISWWQEMRNDKTFDYGWRPFNSNYGYIDKDFGHLGDGPLGTALVRLHYDPIHLWSTVEEQVSFFLPDSTILLFGGAYKIVDVNSSDHPLDWSVSLSHPLGKDWYASMFSVALTTDEHQWFADFQVTTTF